MQNSKQETNYLKLFKQISLSILIFTLLYGIVIFIFIDDWPERGQFGDMFGVLNSVFSGLAFAGVIVTILLQKSELENQRIELSLQRDEMKETRKEFLTNRTTNLIYKQLERFEKCMFELEINNSNQNSYIGNDAFMFLDKSFSFITPKSFCNEEKQIENKKKLINNLFILQAYKRQIENFSLNAYNSVEVVKSIIFKTDLSVEELNDLKNIFFTNIGHITMNVIEKISSTSNFETDYLKDEDYPSQLKVGNATRSNIFLQPLFTFSLLKLTSNNFEYHKKEWLKSIGEH